MIKRILSFILATFVIVSTLVATPLFATDSLDVPFRPDSIATGLVGYWKFNNDATDSSASGYNLTAVNTPTYTANGNYWKDEYRADLASASSQYFRIDNASTPNLKGLTALTWSCWLKVTADAQMYFIDFGYYESKGFQCRINGGSIDWYINGTVQTTANAYTVGKWEHWVGTYDGATSTLYKDGNLVQSSAKSTNPTDPTTKGFSVGAYDHTSPGLYYNGAVKDVAIWNVALTPLQIKSLALGVDLSKYTYRPNNVSTQPTHWWKLNEVSGDRADSMGTFPLTDNSATPSGRGYIEGVGSTHGTAGDYLSHATDATLNFGTGDFSIAWSTYFASVADAARYQLGKWDTSSAGWAVMIDPATPIIVLYDAGAHSVSVTPNAIAVNTWYHFVVKRDGANIKFYQDGVQIGTDQTAVTSYDGTAVDFTVGSVNGANGVHVGQLADVAIWKGYALTDAEIKSLACALPIQRQGIVSYWKMDDLTGNATDSIGVNTLTETSGTIASDTGEVGTARDFEATDTEYFTRANADSATLKSLTDFSIIFWAKKESSAVQYVTDFGMAESKGFAIRENGSDQLVWYINGAGQTSDVAWANAAWTNFCCRYTGATGDVYKNGVATTTGAYSTNPADATTDFFVGARISGSVESYFDGLLDEMIIAKRYFRPEEIKAVYLKGINSKEVTSTELSPAASSRRIITVS
jgi:hypothetical protein